MSRTQDHHRLEPRENAPAQRQRDFNRDFSKPFDFAAADATIKGCFLGQSLRLLIPVAQRAFSQRSENIDALSLKRLSRQVLGFGAAVYASEADARLGRVLI